MAQNNKAPIVMDARKFVREINNGAAATLRYFEEAVSRLGKEAGQNLRLTSLQTNHLMYEDVDSGIYYRADVKQVGKGRVKIENVSPIQVIEEEKATQFKKNLLDLVENICLGDYKGADKTFSRIEGQRYRSSVVPSSGWITAKDGVSRQVNIASRKMDEDVVATISNLFCEAVSDNIVVQNGRIVEGTLFKEDPDFKLPVNESTKRKLIARKMRDIASEAYASTPFQSLVVETASLVCEGRIADACKLTAKFFKEEQEFSLLDKNYMRQLVENTLATRGEFNSMLTSDVSKLMYKVNAKYNRQDIIESWTKTAQRSQSADLMSKANLLAESDDFEQDYHKFLGHVFSEDRNNTVASMYKLALEYIQDRLPDQEDSDDSVIAKDKLGDIIDKLSRTEPDSYSLIQAEEIFHTINDNLTNNIDNLSNFDMEPGVETYDDQSGDGAGSELMSLPEVGQGDDLGMGDDMAMAGAGGPEMGGMGMPESAPTPGGVRIDEMSTSDLLEELESWRLNGDAYLSEDGYDDCYAQMEGYIKRCIELGPSTNIVRESFEGMRDRMVTGGDILEDVQGDSDPYSNSVSAAFNGPDSNLTSRNRRDPSSDPAFLEGKKPQSGRINPGYRHTYLESEQPYSQAHVPGGDMHASPDALRMDDIRGSGGISDKSARKSDGRSAGGSAAGQHAPQRGSGIQSKSLKSADGRKGEHSTSGSAGGDLRMDDQQGAGGVQSKSLSSSDGRKGKVGQSATPSESSVKPKAGGDPALAKGGFSSTGTSMGGDFQGRGGVEKKYAPHKADGASGDGASGAKKYTASGGPSDAGLDMSEFQGREGVEDDGCDSDGTKGQGKVGSDGGLKKAGKNGEMADLQGSGGVAESLTPENIASMIAEWEALEEGELPDFIKDKKKDGDSDDKSSKSCSCCDDEDAACKCAPGCDDCSCKPDGGDDDGGGNPFAKSEDQYKSASMKKSGLKKSSVNPMESMQRIADTIAEDVTAVVFKGDSGDVASAVDSVLNGGGGGDMDDMSPPELETDEGMLEPEEDSMDAGLEMGDDDDLEMGMEEPENEEDFEGELDSGLGLGEESDNPFAGDGDGDDDEEESSDFESDEESAEEEIASEG
mgnify:CR=1 FL=1|tara:strand:+ start:41421 stop:44741 length:3321 start_codon:yes stop_codon:yes gene_type:complete